MVQDMVVELLKDPPAPARPTAAGAERRRSRRHAVAVAATLLPGGAADPLEVQVRDVSLHGAGLRCASPLTAGEEYQLDIGAGPLKLHARVRVVNARRRRDGTWDVGTAFY
jgi:hypothetical protein